MCNPVVYLQINFILYRSTDFMFNEANIRINMTKLYIIFENKSV